MIKILFVCHGNICRSPMAEFLMKKLVADKGLSNNFYIASAATSREEIGNGIYPPVKRILDKHGISYKGKTAVQVKKTDYDNYDYIICMDKNNLRNIKYIIPDDYSNKISLLMSFAGNDSDVADPWYTGDFETTERDIEQGINALLEKIKTEYL